MAKSRILSERKRKSEDGLDKETLLRYSEKIKNKESVPFDAELIASYVKEQELLERVPVRQRVKFFLFGASFLVIPIAAIILVLILWLKN